MAILMDVPYNNALFGLVSYNYPCLVYTRVSMEVIVTG